MPDHTTEKKESWRELCEEASREPDPKRLMKLVEEIDRLLEQRDLCRKNKNR